MKRFLACACLVTLLTAAGTATAAGPPRRPNVILVLTDDQGYGDLSCHGNPVLKTPNIDRLYAQSVRLTDFHVAPMCTPTRGELITGRDCLANGAMNVSSGRTLLRQGIPTMADYFAAGGYRTGQFGKWHLGDNCPYRPQDRGFQETIFYPSSHITSAPDHWNNDYFDPFFKHNGVVRRFQGYTTDVLFGEAMKWLSSCHRRNEPFFVYLALNAAHGPLLVPDRYRQLYKDQPRAVASFFGMIANIDENMGKLEDLLKAEGLRDDTILIFMTDNGGTAGVRVFNAGMRGRKIDLYEGGHRVPCFLRWPGGGWRDPGDVAELTECQDLLPTLIDLCGLPKLPGAPPDGMSLAGLLRGRQDRLLDRMLVVQFSRMNLPRPQKGDAAVLWRRWRLVQDKELYDLAGDPAQSNNVFDQHPDIVARLRAHYERWWSAVEPTLDQFGHVRIGSDAENPVLLSPSDWQDVFLDQSLQVRRGERKNGWWNIDVQREGEYEISLRRWPVEADLALDAGAPAYQSGDKTFVFPAGVPLPIARARLKVAAFDRAVPVTSEDKAAVFHVHLAAGRTRLQTWFYDEQGQELCGAYYVYANRR